MFASIRSYNDFWFKCDFQLVELFNDTLSKFHRHVETPFLLTRFKSIEEDLYNVNVNKRDKI